MNCQAYQAINKRLRTERSTKGTRSFATDAGLKCTKATAKSFAPIVETVSIARI